jgi:general secretion pathway protein E
VEPFLLASTLRLILAQRLVRKLCLNCRKPEIAEGAFAQLAGVAPGTQLYRAAGCRHCNDAGYRGRLGIYEAIRVDDRIRWLIGERASEDEIAQAAFVDAVPLGQAVRAVVVQGNTTVEEALRITRHEMAHGQV